MDLCMKKWILPALLFLLFITDTSLAAIPLPGSAEPGLVQKNFLPKPIGKPQVAAPITTKEQKVNPLKGAEKIKFKLVKITLKGNHVYSEKQLSALYKDKIGKEITVLELQNIVQDITNYYRNNGYILSRAILPPQNIKGGIVNIKIIEGYIDKVNVIGDPRGAKSLIQAYGDHIAAARPAKLDVMEKYVFLANAIPGAEVKAVLEPSKTVEDAANLNLVVTQQTFNASFSWDNYGTLYLGPHQLTYKAGVNSFFLSGDNLTLTFLTASHGGELHYGDINYQTYIGNNGLLLTLDENKSLTFPGFKLRDLLTIGNAYTYTAGLSYPVIRARDKNLTIDANIAYLNSTTTQLHHLLYLDKIRPAQIGATYSFSDNWRGSNSIALHLMHGFNIWNASNDSKSLFTSRFGADGLFTKWTAQGTRNQVLFDRFSAFFIAQGQYTGNPLLVEEQFSFGGSQLGRGYDPAELLGDKGVAASAELRMDNYPDFLKLQTLQLYAFYDIGIVWNIKKITGSFLKESAASTGFGARFSLTPYINGNVMLTQPLTKQIAAEELVGCGRCPRIFFSVTAAV